MRLKKILRDLITTVIETARAAGELTFDTLPAFDVEAPKQADHGDLATNLALVLAKQAKLPPRKGGRNTGQPVSCASRHAK